jgi:hypothetical protein
VRFSKFTAGKKSVLRVSSTAAGVLNLWVDWNRDGVFDTGEQAVTDQVLKAGTNAVVVTAPVNLIEGESFMRLRLSPEAGTDATGTVTGGEVEDHAVTLATKAKGNTG